MLHLLWHSPCIQHSPSTPRPPGWQPWSTANQGDPGVLRRPIARCVKRQALVQSQRHNALQTATQPHGASSPNTAAQPTPAAATPCKPLPHRHNPVDTRPTKQSTNGTDTPRRDQSSRLHTHIHRHTRSSALSMAPSAVCSSSCLSLVALARPRVPARAKSYSMFCRQQAAATTPAASTQPPQPAERCPMLCEGWHAGQSAWTT